VNGIESAEIGNTGQAFGLMPLVLSGEHHGLLYVPEARHSKREAPFLLVLHEAGADTRDGLVPFISFARRSGTILLAPDSEPGSDLGFIEEAIEKIAQRHPLRAKHTGVVGFAEGASDALSYGIENGSRFSHVISLSPGVLRPVRIGVPPKIFIAHGARDSLTPADHCGRPIALYLERMGFDVTYLEFEGGHVVDQDVVRSAMAWFLSGEIDPFKL
jgi:phospholipase/carboxylesterase